jgi:hypothetical protein
MVRLFRFSIFFFAFFQLNQIEKQANSITAERESQKERTHKKVDFDFVGNN